MASMEWMVWHASQHMQRMHCMQSNQRVHRIECIERIGRIARIECKTVWFVAYVLHAWSARYVWCYGMYCMLEAVYSSTHSMLGCESMVVIGGVWCMLLFLFGAFVTLRKVVCTSREWNENGKNHIEKHARRRRGLLRLVV